MTARRNLQQARSGRRRSAQLGVAILAPAVSMVALVTPPASAHLLSGSAAGTALSSSRDYIVRAATAGQASRAVVAAGGRVVATLGLIGGVRADLSPSAVAALSSVSGVVVSPDLAIRAAGGSYGPSAQGGATAPSAPQLARMDLGGLSSPTAGTGVGVALIDTGVGPTAGAGIDHLVYGPDFSGSGSTADGYGHGTFMAGLIAGNGAGGTGAVPGVAPGVTLVSVKVAGPTGATTIGQVIQGIGWAVAHKNRYGIRVMSISFGASAPVGPSADPLDAAVEAAWAAGITVVAAAGNDGAGHVTAPGDDPWVITAGAETTSGAYSVPSWSGSSASKPDVLAPGVSVVSLRDPGSVVDQGYPQARVGQDYFVGSGTSMATALTAGAAALLIRDHPDATPDDVKAALTSTEGSALVGHAGPIDVLRADQATESPSWRQSFTVAPGGVAPTVLKVMPWTSDPSAVGAWHRALPSSSLSAVSWPTASWDTVSWESGSWDTVSWETVSWETVSWETVSWETVSWETVSWEAWSWGA